LKRTTILGAVFISLFALPFAAFGLFALVTAIRKLLDGDMGPQSWFLVPFALVFCGIGFGLIYASFFGARLLKQQQRAQAEHPTEPWLWRDDWAQGRIKGSTRSGMIGAWIMAVLWNLVSTPMLWILPQAAARKPIAYLGLLFPLVGVLLLVRAIRMTLAYAEFGKTCFEMTPVPGVIGGELKGMIHTRLPHAPEHGIQLRLTCVNRVTSGSGDNQNTWEHILWRGEVNVAPGQFYPGPAGASIPVNFRVPWDAKSTDSTDSRNAILWKLEASADVPGVNYHDSFDVPVFRTAQTPAHPDPGNLIDATPQVKRPSTRTVVITETAAGTEFYFPAGRNKSFATVTSLFFLVFGAIAFFLSGSRAPFIFPLVFGFFALILLYFSAQMWLGTTSVGIGREQILVQAGFLGGGKICRFPFADISEIDSAIKSQQGGANGTPYYDIELSLRTGKKVTLARTLKDKLEVDWLVKEMRRLAGLLAIGTTAGV
jgi:hypothetical protein